MKDQPSDITDIIKVSYLYKKSEVFPGNSGTKTDFDISFSGNKLSLKANSAYTDMKYCYIELIVPDLTINSFTFSCTGSE